MKLPEALKILKEKEAKSLREGYRGDATSYAFKRFTLTFLDSLESLLSQLLKQTMLQNKILLKQKKKREPSNWNLLVGEYLRQGKTIQEAAEEYQRRKAE